MRFTGNSRLNDKREGIQAKVFLDRRLEAIPNKNLKWLFKQYGENSQEAGLACFSEHPDSILQWQLYGDKGQGVALGFDVDKLMTNMIFTLVKVHYDVREYWKCLHDYTDLISEIVSNSYSVNSELIEHSYEFLVPAVYAHKDENWHHEAEWKAILKSPVTVPELVRGFPACCGYSTLCSRTKPFGSEVRRLNVPVTVEEVADEAALTSITFGCNLPHYSQEAFARLLHDRNLFDIKMSKSDCHLRPV